MYPTGIFPLATFVFRLQFRAMLCSPSLPWFPALILDIQPPFPFFHKLCTFFAVFLCRPNYLSLDLPSLFLYEVLETHSPYLMTPQASDKESRAAKPLLRAFPLGPVVRTSCFHHRGHRFHPTNKQTNRCWLPLLLVSLIREPEPGPLEAAEAGTALGSGIQSWAS